MLFGIKRLSFSPKSRSRTIWSELLYTEKAVDEAGSQARTTGNGAGSSAWMELGDFNDNSSSRWAPEWKSKPNLLQRPDVFNFQGCGFESLSFQVVEMSRSNWKSSRIFVDRGQRKKHLQHIILKRTSLQKWKSWPASPTSGPTSLQIWVQPPRSFFKSLYLGGPNLRAVASPQAHPLVWQIWSSNMRREGNPAQSQAQAKQTSVSSGGKGELPVRSLGVSPGHKEHTTDSNRQKFSCIFLSFCNKISSVILALRDSTLLYAAAEV